MSLFKRKKKEVEIDTRSDIERKFEETGQELGRKTGTLVQKGVDKYTDVKQSLEDNGTMDKLRNVQEKIDDKIDNVVDVVSTKSKEVINKISKKKDTLQSKEYYE